MSNAALTSVFENSKSREIDRLVLVVIADRIDVSVTRNAITRILEGVL